MSLVSIPFDSGMNEGVDTALLPQGVFREVRNMRLRRDGQLVPRPQLTALTMTFNGSTEVNAFDLWRYRDQLLAVGRSSVTGTPDALDNVWAYADRTAGDWHPVDTVQGATANVCRLPQVTNLRDLPRPLPASGGTAGAHVAAGGGYVCTVWGDSTGDGFVLVQKASDGTQILYQRLDFVAANTPHSLPQVLYINTSFVIVAVDSDDDVRCLTFRPDASSLIISTTYVTLHSVGAQITDFHIAPVRGSSTGFVTVASTTSPSLVVIGSTVDSSGVVTADGLFAAASVDAVTTYDDVTVCADNTAGVFIAARIAATGLVTAWTYTIAGAASVGPTADVFNATADTWTANGDRLASCVADEDGSVIAILLTTAGAVATLGTFTALEPRTFAAHGTAGFSRKRWYGTYATAGILAKTTGSGADGVLTLFGGTLESFAAKATGATDLRAFQGSSNALCQVRVEDTTDDAQLAATLDRGLGGIQPLTVSTDAGAMQGRIANMAQDTSTGRCYFVRLLTEPFAMVTNDHNRECQFVVTEFEYGGTARRQTAELDSQLFVAGGQPLLYAGGGPLIEPSFDTPQVVSVTLANSTGTLTSLGVYNWVVVFRHVDAQGRVHLSPPSLPAQATLGAADDTATLVVKTPHTRRQISGATSLGSAVQVELYRTQNGGATFRLVSRTSAPAEVGATLSIIDTSPDTAIVANPILYTQSQTPIAHDMAPPCKFAAAARSRVVIAGTNDETEVVFSKLIFPGEPIEFAPPGLLGYRKSIGEPVTALMALDEQVLVASAKSLYRIAGAGPDHSGQGEFLDPERIPGLGGVTDWRSVVEVPTGYFFQSSDEKLYFVDRSGAVSWVQGQAVRDTLATYPTITAATYTREQNCVFFACRNSAGNDGVLLVFDLRRECWYVDSEVILQGTVTAAVDYNKRLTLATNTDVYQESPGTYNTDTNRVITGNIRNGSLCSWNHLRRIGVRGSGLGVGSPTPRVDAYIDVENGSGFTLLDQHTVSSSGNFVKFWRVPNQKVDSFRIRLDVIGVALNELVLDIEPRRGISRRNPSDLK